MCFDQSEKAVYRGTGGSERVSRYDENVQPQISVKYDLINRLDRKNQEKTHAYARLKQIRDEEEELDNNVEKFNAELAEFKKYIQEESFKVEVIRICIYIILFKQL